MNRKVALVVAVLISFGMAAYGGIGGSAHDFSGIGWSGGQICEVCHTPHNGSTAVAGPLWDRALSAETYTTYDGTAGVAATGLTKLCLSCHDGTVDLEAFGGTADTGIGTLVAGNADVGVDLQDDHPVMVSYAGTSLVADTTASGLGGTIAEDMLFGGNVECASCHDVHSAAGIAMLLRKSNAGSDLCLTCHNK